MLLQEIFRLVLGTLAGLMGSVLLLRVYLTWLRLPRSNPVAVFSVALTDWLVRPLRLVLPLRGRLDAAALLAAFLVAGVFVVLVVLVSTRGAWDWSWYVPSVLVLVTQWTLYLVMVLVFAQVAVSLFNPHAPLAPALTLLTRPLLAPLRRWIPTVGGFDLSPLVLLVVVQVLLLVLDRAGV